MAGIKGLWDGQLGEETQERWVELRKEMAKMGVTICQRCGTRLIGNEDCEKCQQTLTDVSGREAELGP